jgi:glutathione S-transferase
MRWALERHDPGRWLHPSHGALADMLALIAECDGPFKHALDRCKYPSRYPEADTALASTQAAQWLQGLDERLGEHDFLFGRHATLSDMAIAPFVRQFAGINAPWWHAQPWPHLQAWLAQWQASRLFESVMHKLPAWVDGTEGVLFPHPAATSAAGGSACNPL